LPDALHLAADVAAHPDGFDPESARARYADALTLAGARGMRPLVAHCHLGLARLQRATGDGAGAREHVVTATAMYRDLDMRFWREEADNLSAGITGT
jgi:hypothetical protein